MKSRFNDIKTDIAIEKNKFENEHYLELFTDELKEELSKRIEKVCSKYIKDNYKVKCTGFNPDHSINVQIEFPRNPQYINGEQKLVDSTFNFRLGNKTFEINYHYYDKDRIPVNDKFTAMNCTSWIDAVNKLNQELAYEGMPEYYIDYFTESESDQ